MIVVDDTLIAFGGSDNLLSGGLGSDQFVIGSHGHNVITDFQPGVDRLVMSEGQILSLQTSSAGNTSLSLGQTSIATLLGVSSDALQPADLQQSDSLVTSLLPQQQQSSFPHT